MQNVSGDGNVVSGGDINVNFHMPKSTRRGGRTPIIPGTIGEEPTMIGYMRYLAKRYETFKKWECDQKRERIRYGLIHTTYEREMGYSMVSTPKELFDKGAQYLQRRIANTKLGRVRSGQRLFQTFGEFEERGEQDDSLPM